MKEEIIINKINAKEITFDPGTRLDVIVKELIKLRKKGNLDYYTVFNNHVLYSADVNLKSAFQDCLKMTRQSWLLKYKEWQEQNKTYVKDYANKINDFKNWLVIGENYINKNKLPEWSNLYYLLDANIFLYKLIKQAKKIIELLAKNTSFEEVSNIIETFCNDNFNNEFLLYIILTFANNGPDFYAYYKKNLDKYEHKYILAMNKLNKKLQLKDEYEKICFELMNREVNRIIIHDLNKNILYDGVILKNNKGDFEGIIYGTNCYLEGSFYNGGLNILINDRNITALELIDNDKYECQELGIEIYIKRLNKDFRSEISLEQEINNVKSYRRTLGE